MTRLHNALRELKTRNLFQSRRSQTGGVIHISKNHLRRFLCWRTLLVEINTRPGFELLEYGSFYLVLCNSGTGTRIAMTLSMAA